MSQICGMFQVSGAQWYYCVSGDKLVNKTPIFSVPLGFPNPSGSFYQCQSRRYFYTSDFGNENGMDPLGGFRIPSFYKVTDPSASRLCYVVFDERTGVKIVKGHAYRRPSMMIWLSGGSRTRLCIRRMWASFSSSGNASHSAASCRSLGVGSRISPWERSQAIRCWKVGQHAWLWRGNSQLPPSQLPHFPLQPGPEFGQLQLYLSHCLAPNSHYTYNILWAQLLKI